MSLEIISAISRKYGADPDCVLAGGGNTSYKTADTLYIKGSGTRLSDMTPAGFVGLDRAKLAVIMKTEYSSDPAVREAQVLADLMAARLPGSETKRPSVETLLHDMLPAKYVLHIHPALMNGLTCSADGEDACAKLFPDALWVNETEPGYILAVSCLGRINEYRRRRGCEPSIVVLENHGVFFAADSEDGIDALVAETFAALRSAVKTAPDFGDAGYDAEAAAAVAPALRMLYDAGGYACAAYEANAEVMKYAQSEESFEPLRRPMTPDHIVYCKAEPLFIADTGVPSMAAAFAAFKERRGFTPKIVFVKGLGMFALGSSKKDAETARAVMLDALKIHAYAKSFGGVKPMSKHLEDFIVNWEVESYRASVANDAGRGRLDGKIAIVTGSAQGFGLGIAESMAAEGAYVVIADMNEAGAKAAAEDICRKYGEGRALAVGANVTDEESVKNMIRTTVCCYGGLDVFVNNAGVVRAGSLEEMTRANFELVTSVNYTAYFLCAKYATAPMKIQRAAAPGYMADIIEINSKSGLSGSNKNFAYAGSKFGGLGLTQSFALELAPYGIKVNAVCPGNFLDGPLWSDPEKGLFVQYLKAGKVPGAKTVADVRAYYESKVPLGRGCRTEDVARAVLYIIEQKYETGQAVPVTGGQEMLN